MDFVKIFVLITFLISLIFGGNAHSSEMLLNCHTPTMSKSFTIKNTKIIFHGPDTYDLSPFQSVNRNLSSVLTQKEGKGFTKIVFYENHKYMIHVTDINALNDKNDFLSIQSKEGHEMTYPLTCEFSE